MKMAEKSEKSELFVCKALVSPKGQFCCQSMITLIIFRLTIFQHKIVNTFFPKIFSQCIGCSKEMSH